MLRRHSTKSRADLHRRKSTSSVRSVHLEHLDATLAQRDAQIAATQAFARSQDRSSVDMPLFPPPLAPSPRRPEASSSRLPRSDTLSLCADGAVRRQQSVRFVGPYSTKGRSGGMSTLPDVQPVGGEDNAFRLGIPERHGSENSCRFKVLQSTENLRTRTLSCGKGVESPMSGLANNYLTVLAAGDEYYTAEDDIASAPSSYRRLRRSQSMFSPGNSSDVHFETEPGTSYFSNASLSRCRLPLSSTAPKLLQANSNKENQQPTVDPIAPALRAPKSMSFLRNRRDRTGSLASREGAEDAPQAARGPVGSVPQPQQRLKSQPSYFFRSKNKRSDPGQVGMRKSLRSSSANSGIAPALTSASLVVSKDGSLRNKARKASRSLKSKIKNLFNLSKSEGDSTGPPEQHIEAQKTHVSSIFGSRHSTPFDYGEQDAPDEGSLSRVPSNVASLHAVPSNQRLRSRQGSLESLRSEKEDADEKSRVTSWASSNPTTVASQQQAWSEWERQRLSVIKENGAHCPSPSLRRPGVATPPVHSQESLVHPQPVAPILPGPTYDSQRVYSALMKRYNESNQLAQITEKERRPGDEQFDPFRTVSPGNTTICRYRESAEQSTSTPLTIRCVAPSDDCLQQASHTEKEAELETLRCDNPVSDSISHRGRQRSSSGATAASYRAYPPAAPGDGRGLSPPVDFAARAEGSPSSSRALSDRSSAFFGSPTRHLFRTRSPYRRALRENMEAARNTERTAVCEGAPPSPSYSQVQISRPGTRESDQHDLAYSESVYSCQTSDGLPAGTTVRSIADEFPEPPSMFGDASAFAEPPTCLPTGHRPESSGSSIDWKGWLASNISKLEPQFSPVRSEQLSEVEYALSTTPAAFRHGHLREAAQICGDDDEDANPMETPTHKPSFPTPPRAAIGPATIPLMQRSVQKITPPSTIVSEDASVLLRRFIHSPGVDISVVNTPPPIPPRSALRPVLSPSLASLKSARHQRPADPSQPQTPDQNAAARRSKSVAHIRSLNRIGATGTGSPQAPTPTSAKLVRRTGRTFCPSAVESAASSPGLTAAVERQFGTSTQQGESAFYDKENIRGVGDDGDPYTTQQSGLKEPNIDSQVMGSKRMVDLFLSSRRKRMVSNDDIGAFI